jgi:dipeptidyl aminopeptidase/acylaminoacyl peptidase
MSIRLVECRFVSIGFWLIAAFTIMDARPRAAHGQSPNEARVTRADYERADRLQERYQNKVFRAAVNPHWMADGSGFWYRNALPEGKQEFIRVEVRVGQRVRAFDHEKLAQALTEQAKREAAVDGTRLPFETITLVPGGKVGFKAYDREWVWDTNEGRLSEATASGEKPASDATEDGRGARRRPRGQAGAPLPRSPRAEDSPDGRFTTFIRNHNLYLREKAGGAETALSFDGSPAHAYEPRVFWSPDSKKLVALRTRKGDTRQVHIIASSPRDQLQPKLEAYDYLKPGDQVDITTPHLFDAGSRQQLAIPGDLFANPWSIDGIRWAPDSSRFTFLYNERGHQVLRLIAVDGATGQPRVLIEERSATFIDYAHKTYVQFLDTTGEILWMSERDGWNHLYLFDAATGALKNQVTKGPWLVRGVDRIDQKNRTVFFEAGGLHPNQDPYHIHYARVNLDGTNLVALTEGDGTHAIAASPDHAYFIDTYSRIDAPPVTELRSMTDGALITVLERADHAALLSAGWRPPERHVAKGRDGHTDIYGVIFRPSAFDPARKYPVIEQIYAGPQGQFVPKSFAPVHGPQALAELGFIVVQIDGMGTNWRSKAFHDVCWRNLADAGFPDRILWMKSAAQNAEPAMDLTRVGVYGGSAGGQNALGALLFHGDFYKAAAADCGCHDNRMDKIWWNEAWMGYPVGPHYAASSNVTHAHRLTGKLLLTVGELDRNVDPASTMQVVDALIRANKEFELVVFPGAGHGAGGSPYGRRRLRDFFVRHLLRTEPPDWNEPSRPESTTAQRD